jgi:hypothetical protein
VRGELLGQAAQPAERQRVAPEVTREVDVPVAEEVRFECLAVLLYESDEAPDSPGVPMPWSFA